MNSSCLYQKLCQRDFWILEQGLHGTPSWSYLQDSTHHPKRDLKVDSDKLHRRIHVQYYGSYHVTVTPETVHCIYVSIIVARW